MRKIEEIYQNTLKKRGLKTGANIKIGSFSDKRLINEKSLTS